MLSTPGLVATVMRNVSELCFCLQPHTALQTELAAGTVFTEGGSGEPASLWSTCSPECPSMLVSFLPSYAAFSPLPTPLLAYSHSWPMLSTHHGIGSVDGMQATH